MVLPKKLSESLSKNKFGIYAGAGISQASGLPSWEKLLLELVELADELKSLTPEKKEDLIKLSKDSTKYLTIAEELREVLHTDLTKFVKQRFDNGSLKPSRTLEKLVKIDSQFIITTNYDTLIENAYIKEYGTMPNVLTYKDPASINYNILNGEKFILKAHGDAKRSPSEIILTSKDYREIIFKEKGYQSILQVLFSTCNIIFVGASLKDPELELLLGYIHHIFHGGSPDHYAFMSNDGLTSVEIDRWRKDFNINIIPYDPKDNHKELEEYVDEILKATSK